MKAVLDSFSVLAFFFGEPGMPVVRDWLHKANRNECKLLLCSINWAEAGYITIRKCGQRKWDFVQQALDELPIEIVDADRDLAAYAIRLKTHGGISLADAFAGALAMREKAVLLTGNPEFRTLESKVTVTWITPPSDSH